MILGIIQQQHYLWTHLTGNPESAGSVAPGGGGVSLHLESLWLCRRGRLLAAYLCFGFEPRLEKDSGVYP